MSSEGFGVVISGSKLLAAGTATAATSDTAITTTGFVHISITNDDPTNAVTFGIDEASTTASKPLVVMAGESFDDYISGTALHYSCSAGTPSFRYTLR